MTATILFKACISGLLLRFTCSNILKLFLISIKEARVFSFNYVPLRVYQTVSTNEIWSHLLKKSLMKNFIFVQCMLTSTSI